MDGLGHHEKQLKNAVDAGKVSAREALGQRFTEDLKDTNNADMKNAYQACLKRDDKARFRLEWAQKSWQKVVETRQEQRVERFREFQDCRYRPLSKIWMEEGADEDAYVATKVLLGKCKQLGFPFMRISPWTDRLCVCQRYVCVEHIGNDNGHHWQLQ